MRTAIITMILVVFVAMPVMADDASQTEFIRFKSGDQPRSGALQIAVAHYKTKANDVEVVLFGVVHIADKAYYKAVQKKLDSYDVVLYEGVGKPKEGEEKKTQEQLGGMSGIQKTMGEALGLQFQKDGINYKAKNLVHADMTQEQLMKATGGDPSKALPGGGMFGGDAMKRMGPMIKALGDSFKGFLANNPAMQDNFKMMMAQQMTKQMDQLSENSQFGKVIIVDRNKIALGVLWKEVAKRKDGTIGIFYGAGHNKDFHQRLVKKGYKQVKKYWLSAWKIGAGAKKDKPDTTAKPAPEKTKVPGTKKTFYE